MLAKAEPVQAIITNPPYALAQNFIEHALELMKPDGIVAMLLRTDFDHAKTRQHLFGGCDQFAKKVVLTKRIDGSRIPREFIVQPLLDDLGSEAQGTADISLWPGINRGSRQPAAGRQRRAVYV